MNNSKARSIRKGREWREKNLVSGYSPLPSFEKLFQGFHYTTPRSEEKSVPARMKVHEESFHEFSRVRHSRRSFALKLNEESISRSGSLDYREPTGGAMEFR